MNPKFPLITPSFYVVLKKKVDQYFTEKKISPTGGGRIIIKSFIFLLCFGLAYAGLFMVQNMRQSLLVRALLGCIVAGLGFNVMHDGGHKSFSTRSWVNKIAAYSLNILGGNAFMRDQKHNTLHHTYTNIHELDDDLDATRLMRLALHQTRIGLHRRQHIYFRVLYAFLYLFWIFYADFNKYFLKKIGNIPLKKMSYRDHILFRGGKVSFAVIFVIIPIHYMGPVNWFIGFLCMTLITGFLLSIVFQLAHTVQGTTFPLPNTQGIMPEERAIHQVKTTADFSTNNKLVTWLLGGLNFQVEHHLFPNISHIHYPVLHNIVQETCKEHAVPYLSYPSIKKAFCAHIRHLKYMGMTV